jgi:hypothetical protein
MLQKNLGLPLYIHALSFVAHCSQLSSLYLIVLISKYGVLKLAPPDHFHEEKPL